MDPEAFEQERPDAASIDVSFISLRLILPVLYRFLKEGGDVVALVKPQFEAGKDKVGKNGIVREPEIHEAVLTDIGQFA
ncbi:16S/23S rRNA (cytidine-2'-O)-methyltransferase, partial [Streptomyces sp. CHA15]|nr:16S/23S rRNA (cytidine-2'-O)-methyltransferase [Streptomyces sp. CHA15]